MSLHLEYTNQKKKKNHKPDITKYSSFSHPVFHTLEVSSWRRTLSYPALYKLRSTPFVLNYTQLETKIALYCMD